MKTPPQHLVLVVAASVVGLVNPASGGEPARLLDGQTFVGKNGEKRQPLDPNEDEEFVFQDGRFTSVSCYPYNFSSGEYSVQRVGDTIHFEAVTTSPTHGQIAWKGIVKGDTAEATFVWTKERWYWNTRREYWFKGVRKDTPASR